MSDLQGEVQVVVDPPHDGRRPTGRVGLPRVLVEGRRVPRTAPLDLHRDEPVPPTEVRKERAPEAVAAVPPARSLAPFEEDHHPSGTHALRGPSLSDRPLQLGLQVRAAPDHEHLALIASDARGLVG